MAAKTSEFATKSKQLKEELKAGTFHSCYLLYGEEGYLRLQYRDILQKALLGDGDPMNLQKFKGSDVRPTELIDLAETMPFFAERRVIVLENSGLFDSGCPELSDYLKNPADTVAFLFVEEKVDRRKDLYKTLQKVGFTMECDTQNERTLCAWIAQRFQKEGLGISQAAASFLLEKVGTDMFNISTEMEKLISYCDGRKEVTVRDIDTVCAGWISSQIFVMIDAITARDRKKAMDLYYDLLALKEPPIKIQALITRQFNLILQAKDMAGHQIDSKTIASQLGIMPFLVGKYLSWGRQYTIEELKDKLKFCIDSDYAMKTGKMDPGICVESVIMKCSARGNA